MNIKKRGKLKGLFVLIFLILLLNVIDSAWIIFHKQTITTNIIGEEKVYTISQEFDETLSLDTRNSSANVVTLMEIEGLLEDTNMTFEIETRRTNLNSSCPDYDEDCGVVVTYIHDLIREILSNKPSTIGDEENFTLLKDAENFIEYKIECVKNSCSQRINSNITLEEVR